MSALMTLTFHGMVPKEWIAGEVRTHADMLEEHCDDIREWRVAVDLRHRHHKAGDEAGRRLENYERRRRHAVNVHERPVHGAA